MSVVLGCPKPLVLYNHDAGELKVVGGCHVQDLIDCEGLLGVLSQ